MKRLVTLIAALLAAPAALAQAQDPAPQPQDASARPAAEAGADTAALAEKLTAVEGKLSALEEQYAETKSAVSALQKLKLSGYVQGRYAWNENVVYQSGAPSNDNFFVRRGRLKAVYDTDWAQYVVQLDATTSGVGVKEAYGELKLPWNGLAIDAGLQLFPFGYEVGVRSSADLDLLERSRASRSFLAGEYDVGVALKGAYGPWNFRVGVFNGNGVDSGQTGKDNDQKKDVIGRLGFDFGTVAGGVSGWYGKTIQYNLPDDPEFDRYRVGADLQVYLDLLPFGGTALKGEYIWGRTAIGNGTSAAPTGGAGSSLGKTGHGAYGIVTQNLGPVNQLAVRYDYWDPDHGLDRDAAGNAAKVFTQDEISAAFHTYLGGNLKLSLAYYHPMNRDKGDTAPSDPKADSYVAQLQVKF